MNRSKRHMFVPFCLLNQGVRATGIAKQYSATVTPILEFLMQEKINIVQMACPELIFDGFHRRPCGRPKYDTPENHKVCRQVSDNTVWLMKMLISNGHSVDAVLGIEYSPSCAVQHLTGRPPKRFVHGQGIFIEELKKSMEGKEIHVPFVGVQLYRMDLTIKELQIVLQGGQYGKL